MICPSCTHTNPDGARYCGRCRMGFRPFNLFFVRLRDQLYWIFRRAGAGFSAGVVAWFFIPALSRVISQQSTSLLHFGLVGLLGGAFLGTVDGMVEESSPKTVRGALMGGLGGGIGGLLFGHFSPTLSAEQMPWGLFFFWGLAGGFIGVVSAMWERRFKKLAFGALGGFVGGGVGGALGYSVYAYLIEEFTPSSWLMKRFCEGFSGGLIGVTLWFGIGFMERFVIFKRRFIEGKNHKHCDQCEAQNPLRSWYCLTCGSVLQQAAPAASLNLSPYVTLDRVREIFRFLSRLSASTGVIAGIVIFLTFIPINPFLSFVATVLVALCSYLLLVLFASVAESIQIFTKE